jgi:hypothetical protein
MRGTGMKINCLPLPPASRTLNPQHFLRISVSSVAKYLNQLLKLQMRSWPLPLRAYHVQTDFRVQSAHFAQSKVAKTQGENFGNLRQSTSKIDHERYA